MYLFVLVYDVNDNLVISTLLYFEQISYTVLQFQLLQNYLVQAST